MLKQSGFKFEIDLTLAQLDQFRERTSKT